MTQEFKDHIVQHPNRFKRVPVAGTTDQFDLIPTWQENPSEVVQLGTPIDRQLFEGITSQLADITQDVSITVTVGDGGDYATINEALAFLSRKKLMYGMSITVEIKLLSGFVMREQVHVKGLDLGWIRIISEDPIVTIDRAAITQIISLPSYDGGVTLPITSTAVFGGVDNATLPVIACLFEMNETGSASSTKDGFFVGNGSRLVIRENCGCKNASGRGIYVAQRSSVSAAGAIITGAKSNGISCFRQSSIYFRGGDASGAFVYGVYADSDSKVEAIKGKFTNCENGIYADSSSSISAPYADVSNCRASGVLATGCSRVDVRYAKIDNVGQRGVYAAGGSTINVSQSSILNAGSDAVFSSESSTIIAIGCTATGATGRGVYAVTGGLINATNTNAQKGGTTSANDIRAVSGGTIIAHGATGGTGGVPEINVPSSAGAIYNNSSDGFTGNLTQRANWGSSIGTYVSTGTIPLDRAIDKTITITRVNQLGTSDLTAGELALIEIVKGRFGYYLQVSTDSTLANKLSLKTTTVYMTVS